MILKRKIALFSLIFGIWMLIGESISKNFLFKNEVEQICEEERSEVEEIDKEDSDFSLLGGNGNDSPPLHGELPLVLSSLSLFGKFSYNEFTRFSFVNGGKHPIYLLNCTFLI